MSPRTPRSACLWTPLATCRHARGARSSAVSRQRSRCADGCTRCRRPAPVAMGACAHVHVFIPVDLLPVLLLWRAGCLCGPSRRVCLGVTTRHRAAVCRRACSAQGWTQSRGGSGRSRSRPRSPTSRQWPTRCLPFNRRGYERPAFRRTSSAIGVSVSLCYHCVWLCFVWVCVVSLWWCAERGAVDAGVGGERPAAAGASQCRRGR